MSELIDRKAAIDFIKQYQCSGCSDIGLCGKCAVLIALKLLEKSPAATRWVRCDDPPKKDGKYLVFWKDSGGFCWDSAWWNDGAWSLTHWVGIVPTHWMPIEPPKEDARKQRPPVMT